jgi:hypothetical protein
LKIKDLERLSLSTRACPSRTAVTHSAGKAQYRHTVDSWRNNTPTAASSSMDALIDSP